MTTAATPNYTNDVGSETVARVGSDEFVVTLRTPGLEAADKLANELRLGLQEPPLEIGSLTDFSLWLRTSFEMASGYSTGMSMDLGWTDQRKGVAICALYLGAFAVLYRIRRSAALPLALLAGSMFVAFKAGFVREDAHVKNFFGFAGAALAVPLLTASSAKERIVSGLARPAVRTGIAKPKILKIERRDIGIDRANRIVTRHIVLNPRRQKARLLPAQAGLECVIRHKTNPTSVRKIRYEFLPSLTCEIRERRCCLPRPARVAPWVPGFRKCFIRATVACALLYASAPT